MCIVCSASSTYNMNCTEENPVVEINGVYILPEDLEISGNNTGKADFDSEEAAAQITRSNIKWNGGEAGTSATVTYSYSANTASGNEQVSEAIMAFSEQAIKSIQDVANIEFTRIGTGTSGPEAFSNDGQIDIEAISNYGGGYANYTYFSGSNGNLGSFYSARVAIGETAGFSQEDSYGMTVALHEIAHAVGLSHPGNYNGSGATNYENQAEYYQDSRQYSLMSYWSEGKTGADFKAQAFTGSGYETVGGYSTNLMLHDIAALQLLYGANMETRTGDTVYGFNSNTDDFTWELSSAADSIIAAVWDAGGVDTLDLSGFYEDADVDLREEAFSSFGGLTYNFSIAKGAVIENAIGGFGDDTLLGNAADNLLKGLDGNDTLDGAEGNDTLLGGDGNDVLLGGAGNDFLDGGEGADQVDGGAGDDVIVYDAADDMANIDGGAGFDTLWFEMVWYSVDLLANGFEQSALHLLDAANELWDEITEFFNTDEELASRVTTYDDTTYMETLFDTADEFGWSQWDQVFNSNGVLISEDYTPDEVQATVINGTAAADILIGTNDDETINGKDGNDWIDGGAGSDILSGGSGNDTIVFDANDDLDALDGGEGNDLLLVQGGSVPALDLAAHGFEKADHVVTDTDGSQEWSTYVDHYDVNWVRQSRSYTYDDGTSANHIYDASGQESWSVDIYSYTADGLDYRETVYDDGSTVKIDYDQTNANSWSQITIVTNSEGEIISEESELDMGGYQTTLYDTDGSQSWASKVDSYDASSNLDYQIITYDSNVVVRIDQDQAGNEIWSTKMAQYASNGELKVERDNFDDGSLQITQHDYNNNRSWSSKTNAYDENGRRDYISIHNDDGTSTTYDFDQANDQGWSQREISFDASNQAFLFNVLNDDGTRTITSYDPGNANDTQEVTTGYDALGNLDYLNTVYDDNSSVHLDYDQDDVHNWDQHIMEYDADNNLTNDYYVVNNSTNEFFM